MIDRLPCGCRHNGTEWVFMCQPCREDFDARHAQAQIDYRNQENAREGDTMLRKYL